MSLKSVNQLYNVMLVKPTPVCVLFVSNKSCLLFLTFHQSQFRPWKCSHWGGNGGIFFHVTFLESLWMFRACWEKFHIRPFLSAGLCTKRELFVGGISDNTRGCSVANYSATLFSRNIDSWLMTASEKDAITYLNAFLPKLFSQNDYKQGHNSPMWLRMKFSSFGPLNAFIAALLGAKTVTKLKKTEL